MEPQKGLLVDCCPSEGGGDVGLRDNVAYNVWGLGQDWGLSSPGGSQMRTGQAPVTPRASQTLQFKYVSICGSVPQEHRNHESDFSRGHIRKAYKASQSILILACQPLVRSQRGAVSATWAKGQI